MHYCTGKVGDTEERDLILNGKSRGNERIKEGFLEEEAVELNFQR